MKVTEGQINRFLSSKKLAVAGVSRNEKNFGHILFKELLKKGYQVYPVNPHATAINGTPCLASIDDLPKELESLLIVTPKSQTDEVLKAAIKRGIKHIWVQQTAGTKDTLRIAREQGVEIIHGKCIFMFATPLEGIHKFHRSLCKVFGLLPK